jgi:heme exporter protein D
MPDLGPHAISIWGAYGITLIAVTALVLVTIADDRRQRRLLADLERQGIRRRSAKPLAVKPVAPTLPAATPPVAKLPGKPKGSRSGAPARKRSQ